MERPLRKLKVSTIEAEAELEQVQRSMIWDLYDKVKEAAHSQIGKQEVYKLYDQLVAMHSISPGINAVIASFATYREKCSRLLIILVCLCIIMIVKETLER